MNWDALGAVAEVIGGLGVILTLVYLAIQVRGSNRVSSAQSRQAISEFALDISKFRAEHADRIAKVTSSGELTDGDREFQYWCHMQMFLFGETYFHQHQLALMPDSHFRGFAKYMSEYMEGEDVKAFWHNAGAGFSEEYSQWITEQINRRETNIKDEEK